MVYLWWLLCIVRCVPDERCIMLVSAWLTLFIHTKYLSARLPDCRTACCLSLNKRECLLLAGVCLVVRECLIFEFDCARMLVACWGLFVSRGLLLVRGWAKVVVCYELDVMFSVYRV